MLDADCFLSAVVNNTVHGIWYIALHLLIAHHPSGRICFSYVVLTIGSRLVLYAKRHAKSTTAVPSSEYEYRNRTTVQRMDDNPRAVNVDLSPRLHSIISDSKPFIKLNMLLFLLAWLQSVRFNMLIRQGREISSTSSPDPFWGKTAFSTFRKKNLTGQVESTILLFLGCGVVKILNNRPTNPVSNLCLLVERLIFLVRSLKTITHLSCTCIANGMPTWCNKNIWMDAEESCPRGFNFKLGPPSHTTGSDVVGSFCFCPHRHVLDWWVHILTRWIEVQRRWQCRPSRIHNTIHM